MPSFLEDNDYKEKASVSTQVLPPLFKDQTSGPKNFLTVIKNKLYSVLFEQDLPTLLNTLG